MKIEIQVYQTMPLKALTEKLRRSLDTLLYHNAQYPDEAAKDAHITVKDADGNPEFEVCVKFGDVDVIPMKRHPISFKEFTGCATVGEYRDKIKKSQERKTKGYL